MEKKRPSGIGKKVSFAWSVNRIGRIVFWSCFEGLVGFVHSRRELVADFFFFPTTGPREKNQVGEEESTRSGFFSPGERVKNKRLKCIFLGNVIEVSFGLAVERFFSMVMSARARARLVFFSLL